jgi:hypothetical protein
MPKAKIENDRESWEHEVFRDAVVNGHFTVYRKGYQSMAFPSFGEAALQALTVWSEDRGCPDALVYAVSGPGRFVVVPYDMWVERELEAQQLKRKFP